MRRLALSLALVGLTASATLAQAPTSFTDVDADANGELSFEELVVVWPDLTQDEFTTADADASGGLTPDELNVLQPAAVPAPAPAAPAAAPAAPAAPQ